MSHQIRNINENTEIIQKNLRNSVVQKHNNKKKI